MWGNERRLDDYLRGRLKRALDELAAIDPDTVLSENVDVVVAMLLGKHLPVAISVDWDGATRTPVAEVTTQVRDQFRHDEIYTVPASKVVVSAPVTGTTEMLDYQASTFSISGKHGKISGANVVIENPDIATWSATINNPEADWDVAIMGDRNTARAVSASLDRFMGPALEDGGRNVGGVDNTVGAEAFAEAMTTTDAAARCALFETAQTSMLERVDLVPLVAAVQSTATSGNVTVKAFGGSIDHSTLRIVSE